MNITIEENTWKPDTQVREWVVQGIVDQMLGHHCWNIWHPVRDGNSYARQPHFGLTVDKTTRKVRNWDNGAASGVRVGFTEAEMRTAWQVMRQAGYHIFRVYEYRTWMGYEVSKRDYMEGGHEVEDFTERWT